MIKIHKEYCILGFKRGNNKKLTITHLLKSDSIFIRKPVKQIVSKSDHFYFSYITKKTQNHNVKKK